MFAFLVVALGVAAYLNWVFQGEEPLTATDTSAFGTELRAAQLVNDKGSNSTLEMSSSASSASSEAMETTVKVGEYFTEVKLSRQEARDASVEMLRRASQGASTNDTVKKGSLEKVVGAVQNIVQESSIEGLIKAKDPSDRVVFLQSSECDVVVRSDGLLPNEAIAIKDIISGQSGITYNKTRIMGVK